jgi:hypothetical protein
LKVGIHAERGARRLSGRAKTDPPPSKPNT